MGMTVRYFNNSWGQGAIVSNDRRILYTDKETIGGNRNPGRYAYKNNNLTEPFH